MNDIIMWGVVIVVDVDSIDDIDNLDEVDPCVHKYSVILA